MDSFMIAWRNLILGLCAVMAVLIVSPKGSPVWSVTEWMGLPRCPTISDANGNGVPEIHWANQIGMGADCWPDHPEYVQPDGGWPPDPNFGSYPKEIQVP